MSFAIETLTIKDVHKGYIDGTLSVREVISAYLKSARAQNPDIHAYLEIYDDTDAQIAYAEQLLKQGKSTPVTGIPFAIKDNFLMQGKITTAASKILAGHRSTYDATVVARLKQQGAIIIGRANMDEMAMGSTTENSAYGITKNPLDTSRVPGGSSGGSAAAVAMHGALAALGSDTGGSVRLPASFCGLVGVKPTYGAVSRYGLMAMASSFDQIGPIAKNVTDAELIFEAIRGHDPLDSTSIEADAYQSKPTKSTYRIGVPRKFVNIDGMDKDVRELFEQMLKKIESAGHEVVDVDLPYLAHALPAYYILVPAEVSANLARYDGIRYGLSKDSENLLDVYKETRKEGFGPEVRRRILLGTYVLSAGYYDAYYYKANTLREIIRNDFLRVYKDVDVIIMPTATTPAYKIGEKTDDPLAMYLGDIFTVSANVAGVPAISLPMGNVDREGVQLPVGIQLLAEHKQEPMLFDVARIVEGLGKS